VLFRGRAGRALVPPPRFDLHLHPRVPPLRTPPLQEMRHPVRWRQTGLTLRETGLSVIIEGPQRFLDQSPIQRMELLNVQ
jgi:hypothetical protein